MIRRPGLCLHSGIERHLLLFILKDCEGNWEHLITSGYSGVTGDCQALQSSE